jgi:hypothetical protein
MPDEEDESDEDDLFAFLGEFDREAVYRQLQRRSRPWTLGEDHATVFDFARWAWIALMERGEHNDEQVRVLAGFFSDWRLDADVAILHRAMLGDFNPMVNSGVSIEQWEEMAESKKEDVLEWLKALRRADEEDRAC